MGLVACQDCGTQVSDRASACPHCGGPMPTNQAPATSVPDVPAQPSSGGGGLILLGVVMAALMVGALYLVARPPSGDEDELRAAVTAEFRDPRGAEFRNVRWMTKDAACGEVNGTNGFGGKTGFAAFYATRSTSTGRFEVFLSGNTQTETDFVAGICK